MNFKNESKTYNIVMNTLMMVMIVSFFMPWVRMTIGSENKYYHYIGFLLGGRSSSPSEKLIYKTVNHYSDGFLFNVFSLAFFILIVSLLFEAIQERTIQALILGSCMQYYIIGSMVYVYERYAPYYNKIHPERLHDMECHIEWGFYVYITPFGIAVLIGLVRCFGKKHVQLGNHIDISMSIEENKREWGLHWVNQKRSTSAVQEKYILEARSEFVCKFVSLEEVRKEKYHTEVKVSLGKKNYGNIHGLRVYVSVSEEDAVYEIREWGKGDLENTLTSIEQLKKKPKFVKTYYSTGYDIGDAYMMADEKQLTIRDAILFAENCLTQKLRQETGTETVMKVKRVEVFEMKKKYYFVFFLSRQYEGLRFDTESIWDTDIKSKDKIYIRDNFKAVMTKSDSIYEYYSDMKFRNIEKISNPIENVVSMDSALRAVSKEIGDNIGETLCYTIRSIEMIYLRERMKKSIDEMNNVWYECYGLPVWKITATEDVSGTYGEFYVDMQTGKIQYIL